MFEAWAGGWLVGTTNADGDYIGKTQARKTAFWLSTCLKYKLYRSTLN